MTFDIEAFHRQAVGTPSHDDVTEMRTLLVDTLTEAGFEPRIDSAGNVLTTRGEPNGRHLVLNTHIDTVPPHVPYERDGDIVRGRGACDAKGPLAVLVAAFLSVEPTNGNLTLAITPDEETIQSGATHLVETLDADGYIVGEPTGLDVCTAARGQYEGTITLTGSSAHAATPESGVNAIRGVGTLFDALESFDSERAPSRHELLGRPTLTPTVIHGGEVSNQIPEECRVTFDRRPVPPETSEEFRTALSKHLTRRMPETLDVRVELTPRESPFLSAFETDRDDPIVDAFVGASGGAVRPFDAATEASYFAERAPTIVFGPGNLTDDAGAVAHSEREYVRLSSISTAADAVENALAELV